jgi:hypothetical protein
MADGRPYQAQRLDQRECLMEDYKPIERYDPPVTESRCKAAVPYTRDDPGMHQCSRLVVVNGYCNIHEKKRKKESQP